jgi:hypothetical protein
VPVDVIGLPDIANPVGTVIATLVTPLDLTYPALEWSPQLYAVWPSEALDLIVAKSLIVFCLPFQEALSVEVIWITSLLAWVSKSILRFFPLSPAYAVEEVSPKANDLLISTNFVPDHL